ncbi:EcsC family protein [Altericroceibacterium endophyticum]|uniref:EcsC family protein n=1 Tax=Altericroceibacterium endophyticum TaxID=1808508 RepID=A0A6I4T3Y7_9SPHN|nr:EcsC family protein [Altericroceibacterium endophyticum]MXO64783.1 EcsC family protein [Altericroceibacterium endophyticum]
MDINRDQRQFRDSKPSRLGRGIERLTHPFGAAIASVVPKGLVEVVLKGLDRAVGAPQLVKFTHDVSNLEEAHHAARAVSRTASKVSATTGAAAGIGGALSMSADIPATIAIALRSIRDIGRAYGYEGEGPAEKLFRLQILELAALDDPDVRKERIAALEASIGPTGDLIEADHEHATPVVDQAIERISRAIAFTSFRSRAGMIVPIVGSVVGGIVNSSFQNDVGKAARFAFQARRLKRDDKIIV